VSGVGSAAIEVTFSGVLVTSENVHVILIDPASGRSSGWIRVGESFGQYTVIRYDAASERLLVSFGREDRFLPLTAVSKLRSHMLKN
jgi:hypothetical protein